MTQLTSNTLTVLAGRIREAQGKAQAASVEAAAQSIEAGRLLVQAKAECRHGEWLLVLEAAGVHERQARRLMQLARSGLKSDMVSDLGGLKAALDFLSGKDDFDILADDGHGDIDREFYSLVREWYRANPKARAQFLVWRDAGQ